MVNLKNIPVRKTKTWIPWPAAETDCLEWTLLQNGITDFKIRYSSDDGFHEIAEKFPKRIPDSYPYPGTTDHIAIVASYLDGRQLFEKMHEMINDNDWFRHTMEESDRMLEEMRKMNEPDNSEFAKEWKERLHIPDEDWCKLWS